MKLYALGRAAVGIELSEIANEIGVNRATLYRSQDFEEVRTAAANAGTHTARKKVRAPKRGYKTREGYVEAVAPDEDDD